ncbi:hypothetical protein BCY91_10065 [Pelobium manganitolerans]|uniref:HTH araC/xylS-type domain-containing protein n=1 Tax=Pelobium manganitolerans TaxID=1842495 RepID=A0A419S3M2_9SPHI|nr:AraC family transcriptional regulator [Pelobium manganitolerans]RKD13888.1 hypothetical protein BCY91_10065 [Pelobium manganitolerans]
MVTLYVKSLPLKDVITNLADAFATNFTNYCHEYTLEIPEQFGEGFIRGVNFDNGFGLIEYKCLFKENICIHFSVNQIHPLKFIYCSVGEVKHKFEEQESLHLIDQFQNVIVASTAKNGHILLFPKNKQIHLNSLEISRKEFKKKLDCELSKLDVKLRKLFKDLNGRQLFYHHGNYSLNMADCIDKIQTSRLGGFTRRLFLEGKANEILSIQIQDFEDDRKSEPKRQILRKSDMEKIRHAAGMLKQNLSAPLTIASLAKEVGTNPSKLQEGFRQVFGQTVNNYLNKLRLEYAKDQILIGELNISEIADRVGISNKSYFSRLFKSAYQLNPKEFAKKVRKNSE